MESDYILFKSMSGNNYFYSYNNTQILLIHPIIYFFLTLNKSKIIIKDWLEKNKYKIDGLEAFTKSDVEYYYNKYIFLQNYGYFQNKEIKNTFRYSGENIRYQLANTSQISFEVTDSCNLKCEYCIYGKYYMNRDKPLNINLNIDTAKKTLKKLVELWNSSLNSSHKKKISIGFYGGEALLNMDFIIEIVDYAKKLPAKHFSFVFHITSNGVLLDKYISFLVENDFKLTISLDGGLESNNIYRKFPNNKSAFGVIYKNIIDIQKKYPSYFKKNIGFISVLHNLNSIDEIYEFFLDKFDKIPLTANLDTDSINPDLEADFRVMQNSKDDSLLKNEKYALIEKEYNVQTAEDLTNFLFAYSGYVKSNYLALIYNNNNSPKLPTGTCEAFSRKIFVTARGKILPCERIGHQFQLGLVNENEFILDFDKIAKQYNGYFDNISTQCHECYMKDSCGICMFKQKIESNAMRCTGFVDYKAMTELFSQRLSYIEKNREIYTKILNQITYI